MRRRRALLTAFAALLGCNDPLPPAADAAAQNGEDATLDLAEGDDADATAPADIADEAPDATVDVPLDEGRDVALDVRPDEPRVAATPSPPWSPTIRERSPGSTTGTPMPMNSRRTPGRCGRTGFKRHLEPPTCHRKSLHGVRYLGGERRCSRLSQR